jgi:hypothetical protein
VRVKMLKRESESLTELKESCFPVWINKWPWNCTMSRIAIVATRKKVVIFVSAAPPDAVRHP